MSTEMDPRWYYGIPTIPLGTRRAFWCAINTNGKISHRCLDYLNRHIMPLADSQHDAPNNAEPVPNSEDEYYWTGWSESACEQCDTSWCFHGEVHAWIELPLHAARNAKPEEKTP